MSARKGRKAPGPIRSCAYEAAGLVLVCDADLRRRNKSVALTAERATLEDAVEAAARIRRRLIAAAPTELERALPAAVQEGALWRA